METTMEKVGSQGPSRAKVLRDEIREVSRATNTPPETAPQSKMLLTRSEAFGAFDAFLARFPMHKALAIRRGIHELTDRQHETEYFSLRNLLENANVHDINRLFNPITGSITLGEESFAQAPSHFKRFYTKNRVFIENGTAELRGSNYFTSVNKFIHVKNKMTTINKDLKDGLTLLSTINRSEINDRESLLLYLGAIDYMKIHMITLFHALSFNERFGYFPDDGQYLDRRSEAIQLTRTMVRAYYQALFGLPYDQKFQPDTMTRQVESIIQYVQEGFKNGVTNAKPHKHFTYPEVNHPIVIALGANEAVHKMSNINTIVGIPSGGTESAIVTQLAYEQQTGVSPDLLLVPVSFHSVKGGLEPSHLARFMNSVNTNLPDNVMGKNILLVDDNASSGQTMHAVKQAVDSYSPTSVSYHAVELDGREFLKMKHPDFIQPMAYSHFNPALSPATMDIARMTVDYKRRAILPEFYGIVDGRLNKITMEPTTKTSG